MEEKLRKLMLAMIAYNNGDAKRIQHFIKVHALAKLIAKRNTAPAPANSKRLKVRRKRKNCCKAWALTPLLRNVCAR